MNKVRFLTFAKYFSYAVPLIFRVIKLFPFVKQKIQGYIILIKADFAYADSIHRLMRFPSENFLPFTFFHIMVFLQKD